MQYKALIIGASTGGPNALRTILKKFPKNFPIPVIVVQKIPQGIFAESLAEALDEVCPVKVRVLLEEDKVVENEIVIIPGGFNIQLPSGSKNEVRLYSGDNLEDMPSISNTLLESLDFFKGPILVSILTGICLDESLSSVIKKVRDKQGYVVVQKPESCFIEDLPQTIIQSKEYDEIVDLDKISESLIKLVEK